MNMEPRGNFSLVDHHGRAVTEQTYVGDWMLIFFGFTHCRAVCPRALARLSGVLDSVDEAVARQIQPLYITVDPDRDTPDVMRRFLADRFPRFTGLTGPPDKIDEAKASFGVFARRRADPEDPDGYAVPHTAMAYLLDRQGRYVTHWSDAVSTERIMADLAAHVSAGYPG